MKLRLIPGSVTAPQGFTAGAVFADLKRIGTGKGSNKGQKRDLAVIVSSVPAVAAGMFTTNQVCAAPVKLCLENIRGKSARAIVVNSGNANACTGRQGLADAQRTAVLAARALKVSPGEILVASTGRIGVNLPMDHVERGITAATGLLSDSTAAAGQVAEAIMTSDTRPKQIAVEILIGGKPVRLGGVCKGAGMIQPGMSARGTRPAALHATMLCFVTTDAAVDRAALQDALQESVALSFNRITVDGDMSTNDTVLVLANGQAGNARLRPGQPGWADFKSALNHVCLELARMIVRDGEGVSRFVTVRVEGAENALSADAAARSVANSALVKTSWHGGDPNWGRIIDALGYSSAKVVEEKVDIAYSAPGSKKLLHSLRRGQPTRTSFKSLCAVVASREFDLHIDLNLGRGSAVMYAADLTEDYVDFNKGDVSDPASLGG